MMAIRAGIRRRIIGCVKIEQRARPVIGEEQSVQLAVTPDGVRVAGHAAEALRAWRDMRLPFWEGAHRVLRPAVMAAQPGSAQSDPLPCHAEAK